MAFEIKNGVLEKYIEEDGVTEVVIPEGVTVIGIDAFRECGHLTGVTIPKGVTEIDNHAFFSCQLTSVIIPEGVTRIGGGAFCKCDSLTHVTIPDGVQQIEGMAFGRCGFSSINIPASVTYMEENVFYGCENLVSVTLYGITFTPKKRKNEDFLNAMKMLESRDFSVKLNHDVKYAAIVGFYLKTADPEAEAYIKKI